VPAKRPSSARASSHALGRPAGSGKCRPSKSPIRYPKRRSESRKALICMSFFWSGRRESNPRLLLGRQGHYHYATPAETWAGLDLNQRSAFARQIYSLVPLTTRPPTHEVSFNLWLTWVRYSGYPLLGKVTPVASQGRPHRLLMCPLRGYLTMEAIANSPLFGVSTGWRASRF
jgi:hypothetical protein